MGVECSEHHPFGFQGDQRDEEEETQMKKSESEVEVSTVGGPRHLSLARLPQSSPAWPHSLCAPRRQQPLLPSDLIIHGSSLSSRRESHQPPQAAAMCPHPSTTDQVAPAPTPLPNPHSSGFGLEPLWDLPRKGNLAQGSPGEAKAEHHVCFHPPPPGGRAEKGSSRAWSEQWVVLEAMGAEGSPWLL